MAAPKTPVWLLGLAGGSCSGKTTLARRLAEALGPQRCAVLNQDSYYIDQSGRFQEDGGEVNFDHPDALDFGMMARHLLDLSCGKSIQVPIYDFVTHRRKEEFVVLEARPFILVDGTLILSQAGVRACLQESVFLEVPEALRLERRQRRDTVERGRSAAGVLRQFQNHVKPMHDTFVEPSKSFATCILREALEVEGFVNRCLAAQGLREI